MPFRMSVLSALGTLLCLLMYGPGVEGQERFQIATIKPSEPNTARHTQIQGTKFATTGTTLEDLLKFAYNVHASQIIGGPGWLRTEQFDILADPEMERRPSLDELKAMTADLLGDRFHLVLVHERSELPVFALRKGTGPLKLKPPSADPTSILSGGLVPPGNLYVHGGTVKDFIAYLERFAPRELDRPIVNQTEIQGRFEFELHYTPDSLRSEEQRPASTSPTSLPPDIFTAIQEQLGLKLTAVKAEVEVLHIASVTPPTPN